MADAAAGLPHFTAQLQSLFHWERRETAFGEILRQAGSVYAARSKVQLGIIGVVFLPLILLCIGGFLGMSVIALFMPLIKLLNALS